MKRYSGPRTNPRILSVTLQGNDQERAIRPSHDDVKSFVQRSEEVFRAEDEPKDTLRILQGNEQARATRPSHDDVKSFEDEGGDDLVRWRSKAPEAPSLPRW